MWIEINDVFFVKCEVIDKTSHVTSDWRYQMIFVSKVLHVAWPEPQRKHSGPDARSPHLTSHGTYQCWDTASNCVMYNTYMTCMSLKVVSACFVSTFLLELKRWRLLCLLALFGFLWKNQTHYFNSQKFGWQLVTFHGAYMGITWI